MSFNEVGWDASAPKNEGTWRAGTKLGSNIPNGRFYFRDDGSCHIDPRTVCAVESFGQPEVHAVAIVSEAPRIYTLLFDDSGEPRLVFDDF